MHRTLVTGVTLVLALAVGLGTLRGQSKTVRWNNTDGKKAPGVEHKSYKSRSMGTEVGYCVYTPPGYVDGKDRYPVIYFLHGAGGDENSDAGGFSGLVGKHITDGIIPPVICVFPNGGMSGYADRAAQNVMGETMIIKELVPLIDAEYRTVASREGRAVAGFSMGGGGAVRLAIKHPDLFGVAASWAGAFRGRGGEAADDPVKLAEQNKDKLRGKVRILMVVGDADLTYEGHKPLAAKFQELGITHEYRVLEGVGHNLGVYYQKTGDDFVRFLAKEFRPKPR